MVIFSFCCFPVDSMKIVNDSSIQSETEKSSVENGQDLLGLENVRKGLYVDGTTLKDSQINN